MAAQHRERQKADKGGPAGQVTSLHQEQHPWHMARDRGKRANTQRDAPQKKDKRERERTIRHSQHTLAAADFRRDRVIRLTGSRVGALVAVEVLLFSLNNA
eukprot:432215-Pelagomonas_calceolata.AAC.1